MRLNKASLWLTTMLVLAGCPGPEEKSQLNAVTVTCAPTSVAAGQTAQCTASATDQDGQPFTISSPTWTSSDEAVAKVDSTGKVTSFGAGTAAIRASATADGITKEGQATLTVTQALPQLNTVTVSCATVSMETGQTAQCTASATDQYGQPFTISNPAWTSSDEAVATVDSTGKVTAIGAGTAAIRASATAGGVTREGQITLTIIQPTLHDTSITANETWLAAGNPHVVRGSLEVTGTATLTIEAGAEIRFEQDAELRITTGALRALGTQEAPIRLVAGQSVPTKGYWRGLVFAAAGSASELSHVTLSHCGNASGKGACVALEKQAAPVLRHVTVRNSGTAGVVVADDGSAFGTESTALGVSDSESYAVRIGANQVGTLPADSTFTGNSPNAIELRGNVSRSQTWPNLGLPYVVNSFVIVGSPSNAMLTIPAGTVLRFGPETGLRIGRGDMEKGTLIVEGTETAPVLLTADSASPQPGHWYGVVMGDGTSSNTRLSHVTIEYGGGSLGENGNLTLFDTTVHPVINHVVVRKSSGYGVLLEWGAKFGPGSAVLSAHGNGSYAIWTDPELAGSIPTGGTFHDNAHDAVGIAYGNVGTTQTWPNLGIPYVINTFVGVGAPLTKPTLTLLPGTELRFGPSGGFNVGGGGWAGALKAEGTYEERIRFVPDSLTPTKGFWRGLHFWEAHESLLDFVVVTHAGAGGVSPSIGTGNVNVYREIGPFVINSRLSDSSGCGLTKSDGTRPDTDNVTKDFSIYGNTFINNDGGEQCTN